MFLDYITNTEYGKGLPIAKINTSTFETAANTADTLVDPPFHNGSTQAITWSGNNGNDFVSVLGTNANRDWFQNKIGERITLVNSGGTTILNSINIKDVRRDEFLMQVKITEFMSMLLWVQIIHLILVLIF